ncbi:MAG: hypothetical protein ACRD2R_03785, partial [Terriglobales bacterium]
MKIDPLTGLGTDIGPTGFDNITDLSFRHADDVLFGQTENGDTVGTFDTATGAMTLLPNTHDRRCCGHSLAFDFSDTLYLGSNGIDNLTGDLATIDQTTGIGTFATGTPFPAPPFEDFSRPNAMDFEPGSETLFASIRDDGTTQPQNRLVTIDKATGAVTDLGATQFGLDAIAIAGAPAAQANLAVTKTDSPDPIAVGGGNITYTVTISNAGPDPATNVALTDTFTGAAVTPVSTTPSQGS